MISCSDLDFLQRFYSGDNRLQLTSQNPRVLDKVQQGALAIDDKRAAKYLIGYVNDQIRYYVLCADPLLMSQMQLWLRGALGTSHTYLIEIQTNADHSFEQVLFDRYPHGVIRIVQLPCCDIVNSTRQVTPENRRELTSLDNQFIEKGLAATLERWARKPHISREMARPLGRILRDFFWACERHHGDIALEAYREIKRRELLEHRNLLSLELQAYEANRDWSKILKHPRLERMLSGVVTTRVTEVVLSAVAEHHLIAIDDLSSIDWGRLEETLIDHQSFFIRRPNLSETESSQKYWKWWAIFAFALNCERFEEHLPASVDPEWLTRLLAIDKQVGASHQVQTSLLGELLNGSTTLENAIQVLDYCSHCFEHELSQLVEWLMDLPREVNRALKSNPVLRTKWHEIEDHYYSTQPIYEVETDDGARESDTEVHRVDKPIESWVDWFNTRRNLSSFSYDYFRTWTVDSFELDAVLCAIQETSDPEHIRNVLPHFVKWVDEKQVQTNAQVWLGLAELMAMDEQKSLITLDLFNTLAIRFLETPHSKSEYAKIVEALTMCLADEVSIRSFDFVLDIFESFSSYALKDAEVLSAAFSEIVEGFCRKYWDKLSVSQRVGVHELTRLLLEYQYDLAVYSQEEADNTSLDLERLSKKVGIYSLTETALTRAKAVIEQYCPNVEVMTNSDKTNTSALQAMVKRADIILFCDRSAAHQAYYATKLLTKNIIYVNGKGSSSIVRAYFEKVSSSI